MDQEDIYILLNIAIFQSRYGLYDTQTTIFTTFPCYLMLRNYAYRSTIDVFYKLQFDPLQVGVDSRARCNIIVPS